MTGWLSRRLKRGRKRQFKLFQIEPTLLCSLECVMCPWTGMRSRGGPMSWETFSRIVTHLPQTESVDFTGGGEPLKNPLLVDMVREAKQAGCQAGFSTNGTRLTPEVSEALLSLGLDWISFSVDAATAELYERIRQGARFETVTGHIAGLNELKRSRRSPTPRLMMVFVMMAGAQQNYHQLPDFVDLAGRLGIEQVIAKNLDVILKNEDDERRLFSHQDDTPEQIEAVLAEAQRRAKKCGIRLRQYNSRPQELMICEHNPLQSIFFNWEGIVSPCITLSYAEERLFNGERIHAPCQRFGDINHETLEEIWEKPAYREFRRCFSTRVRLERQAAMEAVLGDAPPEARDFPAAPESCRTCYYLYGI